MTAGMTPSGMLLGGEWASPYGFTLGLQATSGLPARCSMIHFVCRAATGTLLAIVSTARHGLIPERYEPRHWKFGMKRASQAA
jgi:hypothetical protein